jgi:dolichol-phosphate mannosyltransferase
MHAFQAVSIIVPTRNEMENIQQLVQRIEAALPNTQLEIVFVDDSDDETPAAIEAVRRAARSTIVLIHRPAEQRSGGLGSAVIAGLHTAHHERVCVMDGDLQHPPELLPLLLDKTASTDADLVVASRHIQQGSTGALGSIRCAISALSTSAARALFASCLQGVSDPMSGYFFVRKSALDLDALQPHGFKVLLEVIVRTPNLRIAEVGYQFGTRYAGRSKANFSEGLHFVRHLVGLRFGDDTLRFLQFLLVGLSGLVVNSALLALFTDIFGMYYLISVVVATQGSTLWNFMLSERWVFARR